MCCWSGGSAATGAEAAHRDANADGVRQRITEYFESRDLSVHGGRQIAEKALFICAGMIACYALILSDHFSGLPLLGLGIGFGVFSALLLMNVGHDASHGTVHKNSMVNVLLSCSWNLVGISGYLWRLRHTFAHHPFPNVKGIDVDIEKPMFLCLHPHEKPRVFHRFQHVYAPLLYCLYSLYLIFVKDFQVYRCKRFGNIDVHSHGYRRLLLLIGTKVFYVMYALVVPVFCLSIPPWQVLFGFVLIHVTVSLFLASVLTITHLTTGTEFACSDAEVNGACWVDYQVRATCDFAPESRILTWLVGGLNLHLAHHLCPKVSHVHYYELTKIIRDVLQQHGMTYQKKTIAVAIRDHFVFLKSAGRPR